MSTLVGEALETDEAFWNHDTWAEDDGEDAESFRESDEDSDVRKDEFDSDFNDSETDNEADDQAAGDEEERRLQKDEKMQRRQKAIDGARAGRELLQRKKGRIRGNRVFGDGVNSGLVLKFPPSLASAGDMSFVAQSGKVPTSATASTHIPTADTTKANDGSAQATNFPTKVRSSPDVPKHTLASTRSRRGNALHTAAGRAEGKIKTPGRTPTISSKRKLHRFTQEELLLEAATETEPENLRWLLARKRLHQQEEATRAAQSAATSHSKLLQRYVSKRGCFKTLTFSEMDAVPKILLPNHDGGPRPVKPTFCVITGKRARYRDPKTNVGYHDLAAFKEVRRRHNAGEPLCQRSMEQNDRDVPQLKPEVVHSQAVPDKTEGRTVSTLGSPSKIRALPPGQDPSCKVTSTAQSFANRRSQAEQTNAAPPAPVALIAVSVSERLKAAKGDVPQSTEVAPLLVPCKSETKEQSSSPPLCRSSGISIIGHELPVGTLAPTDNVPAKQGAISVIEKISHGSELNKESKSSECKNTMGVEASQSAVDDGMLFLNAPATEPRDNLKSTSITSPSSHSEGFLAAPADENSRSTFDRASEIVIPEENIKGKTPVIDGSGSASTFPFASQRSGHMSPKTLVHTALTAYLESQTKQGR